jgi:hypothetical protein
MQGIAEIIDRMKLSPKSIHFTDLRRVCDYYYGEAQPKGSSHRIYKTPWQGDPRINIQNDKGMAKAFQVRQVLRAIDLLTEKEDDKR